MRARAVTMGKIADILSSRGEWEEALRIRQEDELPVYERLGALDSIAHAHWSIACIKDAQRRDQEVFEHLEKSYRLVLQLGRLDGIIVVGTELGQRLCEAGQTEAGIAILKRSQEGLLKLGRVDQACQLQTCIEQLCPSEQTSKQNGQ